MALGADLLDKNKNWNLKQIRGVVGLPIVVMDLYGGDGDGKADAGGEEGGVRTHSAHTNDTQPPPSPKRTPLSLLPSYILFPYQTHCRCGMGMRSLLPI